MRKILLLISILLISILPARAKIQPGIPDSAILQLLMKRLTVVGGALYVAAHPDDENTAILSSLAMGKLVRTAYLSLNRGEGGQNLIGPEQGDSLGVIRTQELLAARNIDYAGQFFTRAIDFGFSKTAEESIQIWGKEEVLSDVVWVIRKFRPDVIILRFSTEGGGHGHHTASAILTEEAFHAAGDSSRFPDQLRFVSPWKAKRVVWNRYSRGNQPVPENTSEPKMELGDYSPILGKSYTELAGVSRSMHKSQGFGDSEDRGQFPNYFKHAAGDPAQNNLFDGIDLTWNRIAGGKEVGAILAKAVQQFDPENPSASIPALMKAYGAMKKIPENNSVNEKKDEILQVIRFCSGLWVEAIVDTQSASPGETVRVSATAINRSSYPLKIESVEIDRTIPMAGLLDRNAPVTQTFELTIPKNAEYSQPYWLKAKSGKALAKVDDQNLIGLADSPPPYTAIFKIYAGDEILTYRMPVLYRWVDPVIGERYRVFQIIPKVAIQLDQSVSVFPDNKPQKISMSVQSGAGTEAIHGDLKLELPPGWKSDPPSIPFDFNKKGASRDFTFQVSPVDSAQSGATIAQATVSGKVIDTGLTTIDYPHISPQMIFPRAQLRLVRVDLKKVGDSIGYIKGAGDQVPDILRQIGYRVTLLSDEQLKFGDLSDYDAIVVGVRAYNTRNILKSAHVRVMKYIEEGGTVVVQYNTLQNLIIESPGPYSFRIGRDRVSVEESPVSMLDASHTLLNTPNKIAATDFDGWVQERGLYFADQWDSNYQAVLASSDPQEPSKSGGLLYARHGKGVFIYTSYSWFRQLPAGVPGAIRIFANLVSAR